MRGSRVRPFVGILVAGSLFVSTTGAAAETTASAVPQVNPWAALAAMSGGVPAVALCGGAAAVAAAQAPASGCVLPQVDTAPPPAPTAQPTPVPVLPPEAGAGLDFSPLLLALGALATGVLIYFLVRDKDNNNNVSPS